LRELIKDLEDKLDEIIKIYELLTKSKGGIKMAKENVNVGIVGTGIYIPEGRMTAKEIAEATNGVWTEDAIKNKLGIIEKPIPGPYDGTQEMGVKAGLDALKRTGIDPKEIDLILCIGEEWKEYPLTTSGIYIQEKIGATNAWAIDVQQRCCTTVAAMKMAKDMMIADDDINTVMIVGGYRNGDFVDYTDKSMSMMYNLSAGGGAIILKKNYNKNLLLGTHIISDGSLARDAGVKYGGIIHPITAENLDKAYKSLMIFDEKHMKDRLNEISMKNWFYCIDKAFEKSCIPKEELGYLAVLHFKYSMHKYMLEQLGLTEEHTIYLSHYGHMGQIDQILSLQLGLEQGKIKDGTVISMIAAGIGYAWAANVIKWGPADK
jgi:3-oxoacyl-[acyl-carrier-protein] synthase-3